MKVVCLMKKNKLWFLLIIVILILTSCSSKEIETPMAEDSAVGTVESFGYDFVIFDSDGNGSPDDIAKLTCLGMSGGYGSFKLEVFISGEDSYCKVFDSEEYSMDKIAYKKLSYSVEGELMIDTFYSVEAVDTDNDSCEELICRQYAWVDCHSNHVGDVISIFKVIKDKVEIIEIGFETQK